MAKQRLVIDVSSVPARPAGAGRYAIELVSNLRQLTDGFELISKSADVEFWEGTASAPVVLKSPDRRSLRIVWEEIVLARQLRKNLAGIYHGVHYTIPRGYRGARISTIHDLTMIEHPEWHERIKVAYFSRAIRYAVEKADAIIVPSEFTRSRLETHFGRLENVSVIYHGVDHTRFRPLATAAEPGREEDERQIHPRERVVLHIGTIEPRKNLENLVKAFDILASEDPNVRLVLVGQKGWKSETVYSRIAASKHCERIQQIGYLPEEEMLKVVHRSSCVAYPSFAEGFGLPVLEAMAAGVPVVTSAKSVMEEVADGCAWLCDPEDPADISEKMSRAMSGSIDAGLKVAQGISKSQEFNWSNTARKHLDIYTALGFGWES
ncbi:MAG: glycosyltransferase family 1 protein [Actinomycetota bacterium]|nr:glycosyltransferase family 1 protein [Actinomycetota bacterium]